MLPVMFAAPKTPVQICQTIYININRFTRCPHLRRPLHDLRENVHFTYNVPNCIVTTIFWILESDIYALGQILPTQPHESSCVSRPYVYRLSLPT